MVESKSLVLQMVPHTLFIEWDFWILFIALFTSRFTVHDNVRKPFYCSQHRSLAVGNVYDTIH